MPSLSRTHADQEGGQMNGREKLKKSVIKDCIDGENCFNQDGCDKTGYTKCSHRYCNTYKWALDRAKYYADATGLSVDEILDLWEENRSYWYMNYYQDSRQPLITDGKVRVFSNVDEFLGSIDRDKGFRCPKCSGQSSFCILGARR